MIWKSLKEEWPYTNDEIWVKWTTDGLVYHEKVMHEKDLDRLESLDIPEWREMEPPEWMSSEQKDKFDNMKGGWNNRVNDILDVENEKN
jgi:hypothetical protein